MQLVTGQGCAVSSSSITAPMQPCDKAECAHGNVEKGLAAASMAHSIWDSALENGWADKCDLMKGQLCAAVVESYSASVRTECASICASAAAKYSGSKHLYLSWSRKSEIKHSLLISSVESLS